MLKTFISEPTSGTKYHKPFNRFTKYLLFRVVKNEVIYIFGLHTTFKKLFLFLLSIRISLRTVLSIFSKQTEETTLTIKMTETDKLSLFFSNEFPFNKEGLEEFVNTFLIKSYKKGEIILKNGKTENELRFLDKGIVREYYANNDREKNINFHTNTGFITDFSSFTHATATKKYQKCLTDVNLRVLFKEKFLNFTNQYNCGKLFIETIFQRIVVNKETEELYFDIMKTKPDWLLQIPQYHIASYLGITPETLSRIRKRI
jgi:CRP-like cAMP-binding protein